MRASSLPQPKLEQNGLSAKFQQIQGKMRPSKAGWVALVPSFMGQGQWGLLSHIYFYSSQTETISQTLNL